MSCQSIAQTCPGHELSAAIPSHVAGGMSLQMFIDCMRSARSHAARVEISPLVWRRRCLQALPPVIGSVTASMSMPRADGQHRLERRCEELDARLTTSTQVPG